MLENAIGGDNVTTVDQGRERYPVNVRYMRDFRSDIDALGRVLVSGAAARSRFRSASWPRSRCAAGRP